MASLLVASAVLLALFVTLAAAADYGYVDGSDIGPDNWAYLDPEWAVCGTGTIQSPIDIPVTGQRNHPLGPLDFDYPAANSKPAIFLLDHHNGKLELDAGWGTLTINSVPHFPENIHLHTPSEHTIGGKRYPLEIHIVHKTADGQGIAVVGVLFEIGLKDNKFLDQFFQHLPKFESDPEARIPIDSLSAQELGISLSSSYWRYTGSLTTPPCTEGVTWTLIKEIATLSPYQYDLYTSFRPAPDARPIQKFNNRKIVDYDLLDLCSSGLGLLSNRVNSM